MMTNYGEFYKEYSFEKTKKSTIVKYDYPIDKHGRAFIQVTIRPPNFISKQMKKNHEELVSLKLIGLIDSGATLSSIQDSITNLVNAGT